MNPTPSLAFVYSRRSNGRREFSSLVAYSLFLLLFAGFWLAFSHEPIATIFMLPCVTVMSWAIVRTLGLIAFPFNYTLNADAHTLRWSPGMHVVNALDIRTLLIDYDAKTLTVTFKSRWPCMLQDHMDFYDGSVRRFRTFVLTHWPWVEVTTYCQSTLQRGIVWPDDLADLQRHQPSETSVNPPG